MSLPTLLPTVIAVSVIVSIRVSTAKIAYQKHALPIGGATRFAVPVRATPRKATMETVTKLPASVPAKRTAFNHPVRMFVSSVIAIQLEVIRHDAIALPDNVNVDPV